MRLLHLLIPRDIVQTAILAEVRTCQLDRFQHETAMEDVGQRHFLSSIILPEGVIRKALRQSKSTVECFEIANCDHKIT